MAAVVLAACGGGGSRSVSTASANGVRYADTMTVTFNGVGLNEGVVVRFSGPCENPLLLAGATSNTLQYSCRVSGVGRITASAVDTGDGVVHGSLTVEVPLPRVTMGVSDGTRTGTFVIELDPSAAPRTVDQFLGYVTDGFYVPTSDANGTITRAGTAFHRVNPAIGVLAGGFSVNPTTSFYTAMLPTRGELALEVSRLRNLRGSIAMFHEPGRPDSGNSTFFINTVDNPRFDRGSTETPEGYTVFGNVVTGMESVVDEIAKVPVRSDSSIGFDDVPATPVRVTALSRTR
jgi:peptidyl-prolyl cis-trans isomerase A (cyclophilin A)